MGTLYEKIGRRYKPVSDDKAIDGLRDGAWLVIIEGGRTRIRRLLEPDFAALYAAAMSMEDSMIDAMRKQSEQRPFSGSRTITSKEKRAFAAYKEICGADSLMLQRASLQEIVEAGIEAVMERIKNGASKRD